MSQQIFCHNREAQSKVVMVALAFQGIWKVFGRSFEAYS